MTTDIVRLRWAGWTAIAGLIILAVLAVADIGAVAPPRSPATTIGPGPSTGPLWPLVLVAQIGTPFAFLTWLHRAAANRWAWSEPVGWTPGWAIGGWFVPVANVVIPPLVVAAVVRDSTPPQRRPLGRLALVWTWWIAFVLSSYHQNAAVGHASPRPNTGYVVTVDLAGRIVYVVAAALAIALIHRVTTDQQHHPAAVKKGPLLVGNR